MIHKDELIQHLRGNTHTLVLSALEHQSSHGYAITQAVKHMSNGYIKLGVATIYPILRALERDQFVVSEWDTSGGGTPRKMFTLTPEGRDELKRRRKAFQQVYEILAKMIGENDDLSRA